MPDGAAALEDGPRGRPTRPLRRKKRLSPSRSLSRSSESASEGQLEESAPAQLEESRAEHASGENEDSRRLRARGLAERGRTHRRGRRRKFNGGMTNGCSTRRSTRSTRPGSRGGGDGRARSQVRSSCRSRRWRSRRRGATPAWSRSAGDPRRDAPLRLRRQRDGDRAAAGRDRNRGAGLVRRADVETVEQGRRGSSAARAAPDRARDGRHVRPAPANAQ